MVEHSLGKGEVVSSILTGSTRKTRPVKGFSAGALSFPPIVDRERNVFPPANLGENWRALFGKRSAISRDGFRNADDHVRRRPTITCLTPGFGQTGRPLDDQAEKRRPPSERRSHPTPQTTIEAIMWCVRERGRLLQDIPEQHLRSPWRSLAPYLA